MESIDHTEDNVKLNYALMYAQKGLFVLPVHTVSKDGICSCGNKDCKKPGKHPRIKKWQKNCSTDPQVIIAWWRRWPDANVGIACGKSLLADIDIDPRHGGKDSFMGLRNGRPMGQYLLLLTGGGGWHLVYRAPEGGVKNRVDVFPGIDVRGVGGFFVAPPSNHKSGKCYRWKKPFEDHEFSPMPDWLLEAITQSPEGKGKDSSARNNVRRSGSDVLKGVPDGERDDTVFRYGCQLKRRRFNYDEAKVLVLEAARNCEPPFPDNEAIKCLDSAWSYNQDVEETKEPISFSDLLEKDIPPLKYIVPDLLPQGVTLLSGDPKVGKSWLALEVSIGVANAGQVLDHFVVTDKASVLYLGLEDSDPLFKARLEKLVSSNSCPENAFFINSWSPFPKGLVDLREYLDQHGDTGLVVVDCLEAIRDPKVNGQTLLSYDYRALRDLRKIASQYTVAILVIHHNRKMASDNPLHKVSGSQGLAAAADQIMVVEMSKDGSSAIVSVKSRVVRDLTMNLSFDEDSCVWSYINPDEVTTRERRRIICALREVRPRTMGPKKIAEQLKMDPGNVRQLLLKMIDDRQIVKIGRGNYRARDI